MGYRTKALVLALFCLLAVSTLLTTTANAVAKEEGEESHVVVDLNKGSRKILNKKTMDSVGKVTNDIPSLEDEKYGHGGHYDHGYGGHGHGGHYDHGYGGHGHCGHYDHGYGRYGHGGHYDHGYGGHGHGGHYDHGYGGRGHGGHGHGGRGHGGYGHGGRRHGGRRHGGHCHHC